MIPDTLKNHTRLALEQATVKILTNPGGFKGTGFFINPDGYILTAWHCLVPDINCGATITVETIEGDTFTAQLDNEKSVEDWDIAVLKIDNTTEHCVPLGLITEENRGDEVIAIGYPAGYIEGRGIGVYDGIINQLLKREQTDIDAFETTAIEGPGQSGGLIYHFATQRLIGLAKEIYFNEITKTTGLAVRFESLFEKWPQAINQPVAAAWEDYLEKGPKPLTSTTLQGLLMQIPDIKGDLLEIDDTDWPFPVYQALQHSNTLQDYLNVFEAFIHLHFVTLASQFYWTVTQQQLIASTKELQAGLAVVYESLVDPHCGGGETWLRRSAILSLACEQLKGPLPLSQLAAILEPATLILSKQPNTNPATQDTQPHFWLIEQGGERWHFLKSLARLRRTIQFYEPFDLNTLDDDEIGERVDTLLLNTLKTLFQPYRGLQLALIDEIVLDDSQQRQVGVHCYWHDHHFRCVTNRKDRKYMAKIWEKLPELEKDSFRAPPPPIANWEWQESLLLYQPQRAYRDFVYLMPLGFRYHHQDVNQADNPLPALLDSVRWKKERVASVLQRTYQASESATHWQTAADEPMFKQRIERLVQELCENFAFKPPLTDTQPVVIPPQFDLQHDHFAAQLAANTINRDTEGARVLALLKDSAAHRLLLEGASGSGKSVLLAQIFQAEREHAVFISMDAKLEPLEETPETHANEENLPSADKPKASIALRVGMYCLTVLNHLMDLPQPNHVLPLPKVQDAIRDNLAYFADKQPKAYFVIVLDGLNQALDPAGVLGALPTEVLGNLYLLVSSQPQERVRQPLNIYTQRAWTLADMGTLAQAEAEEIVWHYWTETLPDQPTPQRTDLPTTLLRQLCQASHNMPIFLAEWSKNLRDLWAANPQQFTTQATAHFQKYHTTALPDFLRSRLEEVKQDFNPPRLLDALLWCLSLIQKAVSLQTLSEAIQALRQQGLLTDLSAVSTLEIEEALRQSRIGGFVQRRKIGFVEGWQLSHEILGQWFCEQHGQVEDLPNLRLSLVPFGAVPLPEKASEAEFGQWLEWVKAEDYEHYQSLAPELQVSVLDSLLAHLPEKEADHALVLARLGFVFLYCTGEQQRGFALEYVLLQASQQHHFPVRIRADVLQTLGDIQKEQNQLDKALEYFERELQLSEQLLKESATPQNRRDVGIALSRIGDVCVSQNQLDKALEYFERSLQLSEQLTKESATPQNRRNLT
ncbi:MAG: trypsin-like peptidase domain-containing protein, partial [Candidatus Parabeggiatoa sp.]|nr:trypsin-like peptidase domain-containing protein [Candidatus Parabeggiatoa sp.]